MKKAKIILIGGVPGVGKTSISGYIAAKLGINIVLSGDYLREFLRAYPFNEAKTLNYSVYDSWKEFGTKTDENIIKGYLEQGKTLWTGMHRIITRALENGESMIMEVLYFLPEYFMDLPKKDFLPLYLYISEEHLHASRLNERGEFTHYNSPGERLVSHLPEYRIMMRHTLQLLSGSGIAAFDNLDYMKTRDEIMEKAGEFVGLDTDQ